MDPNRGDRGRRENIARWSAWMHEMPLCGPDDETHINNPTEPMHTTPDPTISPDVVIPLDAIIGASVSIESGVTIGNGIRILIGVHIGSGVNIGTGVYIAGNVRIQPGVQIESDVYIGPDVEIGPDVKIGSGVNIQARANIGKNTTIEAGVTVGAASTIPPGSKLVSGLNIPAEINFPSDIPIGRSDDFLNAWCRLYRPELENRLSFNCPVEEPTHPSDSNVEWPSYASAQDLFESGFEDQRETFNGLKEDAATIKQDFSQYDPGKMLYLSPHEPPAPYGISHYWNPDGMSSNSKVLSAEEEKMTRTELVFGYSPLVFPKKEDKESSSPPTDPAPSHEKDKDNESLPTDPGSSKEKKGKEKETKKDASTAAKKNKDYLLTVKIERLLSGGPEGGCQVLLCKATKVPKPKRWTAKPQNKDQPAVYGVPLNAGQLIVVKVFDPLFYGDVSNTDKGPWKATIMADGDLSRENAAYQHLWEKQKTGFPHLAPQYHGPWTFPLTSEHPKFKNQTRRVGAVVIEYIQGRSIEDLCPRNQHYRLVPPKGPTFVDFEKKKELDFNKQMRLKVLKKFMKYSVHQLHAGVEHWWPQPENVLITTDDRGKPRVVLIDYVSSMIDSKRKEPYGLFKDYPKPPHPWTQFSLVKLTNFAGWYPAGWSNEQFATWVYLRFGSLENSNYTDPMTKKAGTQNESESDSEEEDAKGSTSVTRPSTPFEGLGRMMGSIRIKRSNQ